MDKEREGSRQSVKRPGPTYRQLNYWTNKGHLNPEHPVPEGANGSGYRRQWTDEEKSVARMIKRLVDVGIRLPVAAKVARYAIDSCFEDHEVTHIEYSVGDGVSVLVEIDDSQLN